MLDSFFKWWSNIVGFQPTDKEGNFDQTPQLPNWLKPFMPFIIAILAIWLISSIAKLIRG